MSSPKILFMDTETLPVLVWTFRIGQKISINHDQIKKGQKFGMSCICYKWAHEKKVHALTWDMKTQSSDKMIEEFTKIVESADLVVGHNGDKFDIKQINTQRLLNGQAPIAWPTSEDTLKQLRSKFAFPSNKLDYITKTLFGAGKSPMCFQDWIEIVENKNEAALAKMVKYCKKDVLLLEKTFDRIKAFVQPKITAAVIKGNCPRCGSDKSVSKGIKRTLSKTYQKRQCKKCNHVFQGAKI
jgi:transcription elongation factor Elf1